MSILSEGACVEAWLPLVHCQRAKLLSCLRRKCPKRFLVWEKLSQRPSCSSFRWQDPSVTFCKLATRISRVNVPQRFPSLSIVKCAAEIYWRLNDAARCDAMRFRLLHHRPSPTYFALSYWLTLIYERNDKKLVINLNYDDHRDKERDSVSGKYFFEVEEVKKWTKIYLAFTLLLLLFPPMKFEERFVIVVYVFLAYQSASNFSSSYCVIPCTNLIQLREDIIC